MTIVCRCCGAEIPPGHRYIEAQIATRRVRPGTHSYGHTAAAACDDCGDSVIYGVLAVARLWTPSEPCTHARPVLF